jgi:hypothetical protein
VFDWTFAGTRVLWLPAAYLLLTQVVVFQRWSDTHDVINDGVAHLAFFPAMLFGFALARSQPVMTWIARLWKPAAAMGLAAYVVAVAIEIAYVEQPPWVIGRVMLAARYVQCWMTIVALIGIADTFLNRDHRWRPMLTEAVFPFYLIHQTIIIVAMYALLQWRVPGWIEFLVLVPVTAIGCWLFYRYGREVRYLRPLIGLRMERRESPRVRQEAA